jgi:macrolide-specific efflux system membrane fusion protein
MTGRGEPPQMKSRLIVLALAAGLVAVAGCSKGGGKASERYLTAVVEKGDVEKTVLATGTLQPSQVVNVGAQATGQIQSLQVELGDVVKKGQLLGVIDPAIQLNTLSNAQAALAAQEGQLASQQANLERNQLELERQKSLVDRGFTSRSAYDQANASVAISRASIRTATAQVNQARIAVDKAKVDLGRTNIVAPIDGVVASILVREGQTVNAVQNSPTVVRLANMNTMTVKAQISEADVVKVSPGASVYFTILGDPEKKYYGTLRTIEPAPENAGDLLTAPANAAIYYNALFDVPNPDGRLRSSMTAQVNVVLGQAKGVLTAPAAALGKKGDDGLYPVKVLGDDGKAVERKVRVGVIDSARFQVLDGLKAGDKVVVGDAWDATISGAPQPDKKDK